MPCKLGHDDDDTITFVKQVSNGDNIIIIIIIIIIVIIIISVKLKGSVGIPALPSCLVLTGKNGFNDLLAYGLVSRAYLVASLTKRLTYALRLQQAGRGGGQTSQKQDDMRRGLAVQGAPG